MNDPSERESGDFDEGTTTPLVSVTMPNFNHAHYIETALTNIAEQSLSPDEIVVVDDASTDNSVEVITRLAEQYPAIRLITSEHNQGAVAASQQAVNEARGKYVYPATADDIVLPGFLEKTVTLLENHPSAGLCFTLRLEIDEDGTVVARDRPFKPSDEPTYFTPDQARDLILNTGFFISAPVFRRSTLAPYLPWDPELHGFIDGFVTHTIALEVGACFVPENLRSRRGGDNRFSLQGLDDPNHVFGMANRAAFLMSETYGHIWPRGFAKQFLQMSARDMVRTLFSRHDRETNEYRQRLRMLSNSRPGVLSNLPLSLLSLPGKLASRLARTALLISYRPSFRRVWVKMTRN